MGKDDEAVEVSIINTFSGKLRIERSSSPKVIATAEVTIDLSRHKEVPEILVDGINRMVEEAAKKDLLPI